MRKFLCDQMCAELGRWLRAAGYDTVIVDVSMDDRAIFQRAVEEKRLLLTRDRYFKELDPKGETVVFLEGEEIDDWAEQLRERGVDWLYRPFTRCLVCNSVFEKRGLERWYCPICEQEFWLGSHTESMHRQLSRWNRDLTIGFGGDVMIGRLVNEILDQKPSSYIWGDLLPILKSNDLNVVNLETTLTTSMARVPKVFNFKADPEKVAALKEGRIDVVNLANNHCLDFAEEGLLETIRVLDLAHIFHVGAGRDLKEAKAPCVIEKKGMKIGLLGCTDNEPTWKATTSRPGTNFLEVGDLDAIRESIVRLRPQVDLLILSMHWGPNMRQRPAADFRSFAHELIDLGVDILHGHSAHLFQGVEIYKKGLILYDTGDLVDDYAIDPILRNDRSFYFVVQVNKKGMVSLRMIPTIISECQVNISKEDGALEPMEKLCNELGTFPSKKLVESDIEILTVDLPGGPF